MRIKRVIASIVVAGAVAAVASPAQAAGQDGTVENDEFIFYYNSNLAGSFSDFATSKTNLDPYDFLKPGLAGYGQTIGDNAASVRNLRASTARVYVSTGYIGVYDQVAAESSRNLSLAYNNNASFRW